MILNYILLSEATTEHRMLLCTLSTPDDRERLIRSFDRICDLVGGNDPNVIKTLKDELEEVEDAKSDLEQDVSDLKEQIEDLNCDAKKILRHLQESIGIAICLAEKDEHRIRLHGDFDVLERYLSGQIEFDQLKYPLITKREADHAA